MCQKLILLTLSCQLEWLPLFTYFCSRDQPFYIQVILICLLLANCVELVNISQALMHALLKDRDLNKCS